MQTHPVLLGCLLVALGLDTARPAAPAETWGMAGRYSVGTLAEEWQDAARGRTVPVKVYWPKTTTNAVPAILFSHGLGGTRDGYEYLGRHWASHGYAVVHLQHPGSDDTAWRGQPRPLAAMSAAAGNPTNALNRVGDVRFVLDRLTALNTAEASLPVRLDLAHVGLAGHSFGAHTTLATIGQRFAGVGPSRADPRIRAAIAMSAPVPKLLTPATYADVKTPVFHLTGTRDNSPIGDTSSADRRVPFDRITQAPELLLTLQDGDHMVFSGRPSLGRDRAWDARHHALILAGTTAFWEAFLKDDPSARKWLLDGGYADWVGADAVLEQKQPASKASP